MLLTLLRVCSKLFTVCVRRFLKYRVIQNFHIYEPVHEIFNNVVCVTSKASDQPAHMRSLIRAFVNGLIIL